MRNSEPGRLLAPSDDAHLERVHRLAKGWLVVSVALGGAVAAVGAWVGSLEHALLGGVTAVAIVWGFLGSLSLLSAKGAQSIERSLSAARINRRIRAGRAEPERAAVSVADADSPDGALSPVDPVDPLD